MNEQGPSLLADVRAVFEDLLRTLPEGCASVRAEEGEGATTVLLQPSNPDAAPIAAIVPGGGGGVTLVIGRGSFFEIPREGRRYTHLPLIEEVRAICTAAVRQGLEETVEFRGPELLKGTGTIRLAEPVTVRWRRAFFNPFRARTRERVKYQPYC